MDWNLFKPFGSRKVLNAARLERYNLMREKTTIGMTEKVFINDMPYTARVDTGAHRSSMDIRIAGELKLGPILRTSKVKSAHGTSVRPVIKAQLKIKDRVIRATFTLTDRKELEFPILIGRNILKFGFLIDTTKK